MCVPEQVVHLVRVERAADDIAAVVSEAGALDNADDSVTLSIGQETGNLGATGDDVHRDLFVDLLSQSGRADGLSVIELVEDVFRDVAEGAVPDVVEEGCQADDPHVAVRNLVEL